MDGVLKVHPQRHEEEPYFIFHPSFEDGDENRSWLENIPDTSDKHGFMPDETTRDLSKRMHYAAWRVSIALTTKEAAHWRGRYIETRNRIVVGNRKLIYRAVQKWIRSGFSPDDLVGECQIVMVRTVARFNPWLGIRFSTYAMTCLMRALSRLVRRQSADRLSPLSPVALAAVEPVSQPFEESEDPTLAQLSEFFRDDVTLLTAREKLVISRRYRLDDEAQETETLEQVGRQLGLSKERVRQVQNIALRKLRDALADSLATA